MTPIPSTARLQWVECPGFGWDAIVQFRAAGVGAESCVAIVRPDGKGNWRWRLRGGDRAGVCPTPAEAQAAVVECVTGAAGVAAA